MMDYLVQVLKEVVAAEKEEKGFEDIQLGLQ